MARKYFPSTAPQLLQKCRVCYTWFSQNTGRQKLLRESYYYLYYYFGGYNVSLIYSLSSRNIMFFGNMTFPLLVIDRYNNSKVFQWTVRYMNRLIIKELRNLNTINLVRTIAKCCHGNIYCPITPKLMQLLTKLY